MEFRILGAMEVLDGTRRARIPSGRGRALLALLVLHAGEAVPTEDRIDADLALGRTGLVAEIDALVKRHPFRERLRALQMLALYREGRQAEALTAYRAARATLAEEMGIDLGPGLRDLHEKILRQDSSLEMPTTPAGMGTWLPGERQVALSLSLAEVHLVLGQFGQAQAMLRNIIDAGDAFAAHAARLEHARIQFIIGPDPVPLSQIEDEAHAAAEYFKADDAARARAAFLLGCVRMREGRMTDAEATFRESMARADRAVHMRARLAASWMGCEGLGDGPTPGAGEMQRV